MYSTIYINKLEDLSEEMQQIYQHDYDRGIDLEFVVNYSYSDENRYLLVETAKEVARKIAGTVLDVSVDYDDSEPLVTQNENDYCSNIKLKVSHQKKNNEQVEGLHM